jgi:hypothetical protein
MMVQRYAPSPTRAVDYRPMRPLYLRTSGRPGTLRTEWKIAMRGSEHTTTIGRKQRVAITSMARGIRRCSASRSNVFEVWITEKTCNNFCGALRRRFVVHRSRFRNCCGL